MNHQKYEEWLFAHIGERDRQLPEEKLTEDQEIELQTHLKGCVECRLLASAWQNVDQQLREATLLAPKPGFTQRWELRLKQQRQLVQHRQTVAVLGFGAVGIVSLLASLVLLTLPIIQTPKALVWLGIYRLITLFAYAQMAQDTLLPFLQTTLGAVPGFWWLIFAGLLTQLGVLWVVTYRLLMNPWRITR